STSATCSRSTRAPASTSAGRSESQDTSPKPRSGGASSFPDRTMADPLITLTTDFGERSPYVAPMKGVILAINPAARVVDLSHQIRPQALYHASYFLGSCLPYFPRGTIHVAVIDPGVGTERVPLLVRAGAQFLIGPDNGIFTAVIERMGPAECWQLINGAYWQPTISPTFHGRDVFAPVAARLSEDSTPSRFGSQYTEWVRL